MEKTIKKEIKTKESQRMTEINDRYKIIIFLGLLILFANILVLVVNSFDSIKNNMAHDLAIENYKLKQTIENLTNGSNIPKESIIQNDSLNTNYNELNDCINKLDVIYSKIDMLRKYQTGGYLTVDDLY